MPNILSIDPGTRHLGFVIYQPHTRNILLWGVAEIPLDKSSYLPALLRFERQCEGIPYSIVVIERQLRHRNVQAGRIEANLEALFYARGKRVHIMAPERKYDFHGLQMPATLWAKFARWEDAALGRGTAGTLSRSQQTRLNKKMAREITSFFLTVSSQTATIQAAYTAATKKDDMADALLQAMAYANTVLVEGVIQHAEVIVVD